MDCQWSRKAIKPQEKEYEKCTQAEENKNTKKYFNRHKLSQDTGHQIASDRTTAVGRIELAPAKHPISLMIRL